MVVLAVKKMKTTSILRRDSAKFATLHITNKATQEVLTMLHTRFLFLHEVAKNKVLIPTLGSKKQYPGSNRSAR